MYRNTLKSYLRFDKLIAPTLLRVLFWPALAACIYYSSWLIVAGNPIGWIPLTIGSLFVRILFEGMILFFSINEKLQNINQSLSRHD
ncbi:MAG: hypothetical protein DHS20C17_26780 [Cyclobacteriaceae bacterium]|nr:MAG: hypothetical protein DHS20C17_26780 [Cyclobacteriaceae bacterium]